MQNGRDKLLFEEIEKVYDSSAVVFNELTQEILNIEEKYGTASKLLTKKRDQLDKLRALYDKTLAYINFLRELNEQMYQHALLNEFIHQKKITGLPFQNIANLAGWEPEQWKKLDALDNLITKICPASVDNDFQMFIERLRK